ncbi:hypothetical protein SAMN04487969_10522 [Paenibacillus algorifonticola]|uniref:Uncharacterized protein n=1 Tax=Paenibacillus algorifonticola TaxID=684063 RepID=A0A1I2CE23_9BACL|nr:hypothetical protein [Paenibacillus algorifonticola]SFE66524.1 hypothetical protein SAMN04487969_10522 [Paenibacillus algorifonticola]
MRKLEEKLWYGVFVHNSYNVIAQELESCENNYRRFAAVYIMEKNLEREDLLELIKDGVGSKYLVMIIDISNEYIEVFNNSWDSDLYERDIKIVFSRPIENELSLYESCEEMNVDPGEFVTPWKCDYIFD